MIKGFVQGQTLKLAQTRIVADTIDYLIAKFHFQGEDWRGLEKWMHLQQGEQLYAIKLIEDKTQKSDHLNLGAGEWAIWLHGNENSDGVVVQRITTNICSFTVIASGALEGEVMPELPASLGEQIDARLCALEQTQNTSITVDTELSQTSENPVQNMVITQVVQEANVAISGLVEAIETLGTNKLDASALSSAITTALAQAKESGNFDGITPVKGTDYFTEADKAEIVALVIESLGGNPVFGYVDENNNIVFTGALADGTYNIKYEMEDGSTIEIGDLVLDSNVYYSITNTLTNCTNGNSALSIVEGESYSATITANGGYELSSVKVTMGGTDISSTAVSGGNISIASVTGNIVITAVATEQAVTTTYTNLLPLSVDADGTDYVGDNGEDGYNTGYKLSSSKGTESPTSGACVSGYIPITAITDVIRIKNIVVSSAASINNITFHKADKTRIYGAAGTAGALFAPNVTADGNGVYDVSPSNWLDTTTGADLGFFRFSCGEITDETIVTVNEEIV